MGDLVIGLDSSTQSTKAIAWSREGEPVAEGRAPVESHNPGPGRVEQHSEDWWHSACTALKGVFAQVDPRRIAGLAVSNQRETVAFMDEEGREVRPAIVWLDERATEALPVVVQEFGGDRLHRITGKPVDITPVVYRLSWMKRQEPQTLARTARILDVHGFLTAHLTGRAAASWTSADPFGVLDIGSKTWSRPILEYLDLPAQCFADLVAPGARVGTVTASAARATGLISGTPVVAAGGDGQCAGLGVNAIRPGTVYLNLGTAIITGAWSADAQIGPWWRTMTSPTGEGYFLEGCQRAGAFFINWLIDNFAGGRDDRAIFDRLENEARAIPVGSAGVTVCPYLTGCMDPHWDPEARAAVSGLGASHGMGHLYRASLEALTLESARCVEAMTQNGLAPQQIIAVGGGANSPTWVRMFADATGLPLTRSESPEASALGAGISAAVGVGWFDSFALAAAAMCREGETIRPDPARADEWAALSLRQAGAYRPE